MIRITITAQPAAQNALLYERLGRQGRRRFVRTYVAFAECSVTDTRFDFAVARASSTRVFGLTSDPDVYGVEGECPPCGKVAYRGLIREDGEVGFRVQLVEPGYETLEAVVGRGCILRKHIQIHFGAAASHGCLLVAGRRREYARRFARPLQAMLAHDPEIEVLVLPADSGC